jgi:protein-S-isoprenylcysteine O-methyltransferase Ste14
MMRLITFIGAMVFLGVVGTLMFLIAGTIALPPIWLNLGIWAAFTLACVLVMSENVAKERLKPGPGAKKEPLFNIGSTLAYVAHYIIAPLDLGRFHWSRGFPTALQVIGMIGMLLGFSFVVWALRHNEFLSSKIRIQKDRGQQVVDSGPYAIIRHPNTAGGCLQALCSGLVLTSWLSILPMLIYVGVFVHRTLNEEKVLLAELEGYQEYTQRVRYRMIPGVW